MPKSEETLDNMDIEDVQLPGVIEQDDGSAIIEDADSEETGLEGDFSDNLVKTLSESELNTISANLIELIERDREARKARDDQQAEGIRRTGLGDDAPGGATFSGASKVVHPIMAEGCVDFSARAIKELFPANGPVRTKIIGDESDSITLDKAKNKRDFLNFYLTTRMPEYRSEKETMLTQLPLGGSQFEKFWFDGKRIRMAFLPIDKVFLPYASNSFYTAPRKTEEQERSEDWIESQVESGFYEDVFGIEDTNLEGTASQEATEKIEGKEASGYNEDGVRIIYEVTANYDIDGTGRKPYIIHIDQSSERIAAIYRNWKESDEAEEELAWVVESKFLPWRGAYGIGLPQLIGGLSAALTGGIRALLDSAHINNMPTAVRMKGARASGQNVNLDITAITEIEAPPGVDDVRKIMMPLPFNPPSQVLFTMVQWLTEQAKGVVATAEEQISNSGANMPVGTALALIEQGSQVFSSIHARLHDSQRRALKIICRLIADYPEHAMADMARFDLVPADFLSTDDVEPVSDPNIFSETQRYAQMQAVLQLSSADIQDPSVPWNKLAIRRRMLELLRVDGIDELLPKPQEPITDNPVAENLAIMQGQLAKAVLQQDHQAHIKVHLMFVLQPLMKDGPGMTGPTLAKIMDHVSQHMLLDYQHVTMAAEMLVKQRQPDLSPDQVALQAAMMSQDQISQEAQALLPLLNEAMQIVQAKSPPPQQDPGIAATKEVAMAQIQQKAQTDQANLQMAQAKLQGEQQLAQMNQQLEQAKFQFEAQTKEREFSSAPMLEAMKQEFEAKLEVERMQRDDDRAKFSQMIEMQKNEADNYQKQMTELMKNRDDNETAIKIKLMELQGQVSEAPQTPDFSPMMQEMQTMLSQIEKAKTGDALTATVEGLKAVMQQMNAPTELIRQPQTGKTIGMRKVVNQVIEE